MLHDNKGNIFAVLFAAVALIGVLAVTSMQTITGPITTATNATNKNMIGTHLLTNTRLVVMDVGTLPAGGDADADGMVEPVEYVPNGSGGCTIALTGGGCLPSSLGAALTDPYGSPYGYCVWDHGAVDNGHADGSPAAPYRLKGGTNPALPVIALISAGPDKAFQTTCRAFDGAGEDGPIKPVGSDDFLFTYTYNEALASSGGLWTVKPADPQTAEISKDLEVKDAGGNVTVSVDRSTGIGDFLGITTDLIVPKTGEQLVIDGKVLLNNTYAGGVVQWSTNPPPGLIVKGSVNDGIGLAVWDRDGETSTTNDGDGTIYWGDDNDDNLRFAHARSDQPLVEKMRLTSAGRLGVMTSDPRATLHVFGGVRARQGAPSNDLGNVGYAFGGDGDTGLFSPGAETDANGTVALYVNNAMKMQVKSVGTEFIGPVGIGVAPSSVVALDVNGDIRVGGNNVTFAAAHDRCKIEMWIGDGSHCLGTVHGENHYGPSTDYNNTIIHKFHTYKDEIALQIGATGGAGKPAGNNDVAVPNGNLTIGTSASPNKTLYVYGGLSVTSSSGSVISFGGPPDLKIYNADRCKSDADDSLGYCDNLGRALVHTDGDVLQINHAWDFDGGVRIGDGGTYSLFKANGDVGIKSQSPVATLDVNGFLKLKTNTAEPVACAATYKGSIALTSGTRMCLCNGTSWVEVNTASACTW